MKFWKLINNLSKHRAMLNIIHCFRGQKKENKFCLKNEDRQTDHVNE